MLKKLILIAFAVSTVLTPLAVASTTATQVQSANNFQEAGMPRIFCRVFGLPQWVCGLRD